MKQVILSILQTSLCTFGYLYITVNTTLAQITSDGTVNTQVNTNGNIAEITGGETRGSNLFHSFQDFSVSTGNEAFFNNASDISNILSRVTGGNISNIDGLIRANGSASLFLINPAGIIFGENARLDIGGSFFGSTANSILFPDEIEFSATDTQAQPILTINAPIGLSFRDNPADLTVRGDGNGVRLIDSEVIDTQDALRVGSDATIGIVGGNLFFEDATIKTAGGRIEIGSVAGGEVDLIEVANGFTLDYSGVEAFRDISLSGTSVIDASGLGGGDIQVAGKNISITGVSGFLAHTLGSNPGGDINIFASESVEISAVENELNFGSAIANQVFPNGTADGGDINIETGSLRLGDRALITTTSFGQGDAGNITINASDSISLESQGNTSAIGSNVTADAIGNGGDINISTPSLTLSNGAFFNASSSGEGNAGNINISGNSLTLNNGAGLFAANNGLGAGGNVTINATDDVSFTNGSRIFVAGASGGSINITAKNLSLISDSAFLAGINVDSGFADAQAGDIVINLTEDLVLDGLDSESVTTIGNSNFGTGNAGSIEISARNITLKNGGNIDSSTGNEGDIGNITLTATEDILFDGIRGFQRSGISNSVDEGATADIGEINITARNLTLTNGAEIGSQVSGTANSGDINLNVADTVRVDGSGDVILEDGTQSVLPGGISSDINTNGRGNSGNININTQNLSLSRNGFIGTNVFGQGNAGNITINANLMTIGEQGDTTTSPSSISSEAISGFLEIPLLEANGGNITINTGSLFISDGGSIAADVNVIGNAGNIKIIATDTVSVDGTGTLDDIEVPSGISASTNFSIPADGLDNGGSIEINTPQLSITNGAQINASTFGQVDAGSIAIETQKLTLSDGARIEVGTLGQGDAGLIAIDTEKLTVSDGAQIGAGTNGQGDAGDLTISASESIELRGTTDIGSSGLFATALVEDGNGGNLQIFTQDLIVGDGAIISVSNFPSVESVVEPGTGEAGNLTVEANSLRLESGSIINAATQAGNGGNITLQIADDITMRDNSLISARAFKDANGGNITIDTNLIIAFPGGNNDIIANAQQGQGGNINITAESLFGIEERPLNPNTNDINASSEFSLDGTVTINTPDINPIQGATELPQNIVAPEQTTAQTCQANREIAAKNRLNILGKGGIPPAPDLPLDSHNIAIAGEFDPTSAIPQPIETSQGKIQPARGVKVTES
ncbi:MAG: filamentous hemagglutinin N-terminal domain-containing protein, partial [Pleurocapsa sp. MO_226.B13]|nr:filamentous hemagglutinin N-terminal domain-containing protein [Pleurocapsa sp. MO_226.B13]